MASAVGRHHLALVTSSTEMLASEETTCYLSTCKVSFLNQRRNKTHGILWLKKKLKEKKLARARLLGKLTDSAVWLFKKSFDREDANVALS